MIRLILVFGYLFIYCSVSACIQDTIKLINNDGVSISIIDQDNMILNYRDQLQTRKFRMGYDFYFHKGRLEEVIYFEDSIKHRMIYKKEEDGKWEFFNGCKNGYYPSSLDTIDSQIYMGLCGKSNFVWHLSYDAKTKGIKNINQMMSDHTNKQEGLTLNFKRGNPVFLTAQSYTEEFKFMMFFNRRGQISKLYTNSFIERKTGLNFMRRYKYREIKKLMRSYKAE